MVLRGTCTSVRPRSFATHVEAGRPQSNRQFTLYRPSNQMSPPGPRRACRSAGRPTHMRVPMRESRALSAHGLHDPALVALPVAVFVVGALVVLFLALCQPDLE